MNCSSQQITLRRLDKAFKAFFARCATGQSPGFPRFKSLARMPGIGFKGHGDGWRFAPNLANEGRPDDFGVIRWTKHGTLRLQGLGHIKLRGQARAAGVIKSCELLHSRGAHGDEWHVSVTIECAEADVARERHDTAAAAASLSMNYREIDLRALRHASMRSSSAAFHNSLCARSSASSPSAWPAEG